MEAIRVLFCILIIIRDSLPLEDTCCIDVCIHQVAAIFWAEI